MGARTEYGQWTGRQSELIPYIPPDVIPHGALFPIEVIQRYMNRGIVVELGAGRGTSAQDFMRAGFAWMGFEINDDAVEAMKANHYPSFQGDARNFWASDLNLAAITMIENADAVLLQGLLANIVENRDIRNVLRTADIFLRPEAYLFIAEPVRFDQAYWLDEHEIYAGLSLGVWRKRWEQRYALNEKAGLPKGVFAVAKMGINKDTLDWAETQDEVDALISSDQIERYARHINEGALISYAKRQHLTPVYHKNTLMFSRNNEPLPGVCMVFQKDYGLKTKRHTRVYRYSPWFKGLTPEERHKYQPDRQWRAHSEEGYYEEFWDRLRKNFPSNMIPPREYTIGQHASSISDFTRRR